MYANGCLLKYSIGQTSDEESPESNLTRYWQENENKCLLYKSMNPSVQSRSTVPHTSFCNSQTRTHISAHSNSMRLKVAVLIEYINLTTDVIDQKANSSSIIVLEGKTIAKWLCKVHSLGKQIWDPLKPWRLSSLSPTICGDCSKHLAGDLPRPVESQWETWQGARQRHKRPLHFNYTSLRWLAISLSPFLPYIAMCPYQYLGPTYTVQMCHRLNSPHDTAGHT